MDWSGSIANLRKYVAVEIEKTLFRLFGFTIVSSSSEMGEADAMQLADTQDGMKGQRPAQRIEPFGLRFRTTNNNIRGLWLRLGSSNVAFLGILPSRAYGPVDLNSGEVCLYSEQIEKGVHLTEDGDNKLFSKIGQTVQINGNDFSLPKTEDLFSDLLTFFSAAAGPAPIVSTITGSPIPPFSTAAGTLFTKLTSGVYKSTKAKNG